MPDLGPFVGGLAELLRPVLGPLVSIALRAMVGSAIGVGFAAALTAFGAYELGARSGSPGHGAIAALLAGGLFLVLGPVLLLKRGIGRAVAHAIGALGLGRKLTGLLFDGLVGMEEDGAAGERGGKAQRAIERLPLVEVERRLRAIVARVTGSGEGFVSARVRSELLDRVARFTLEELRAEGASAGGVDLVRARVHIDGLIAEKLVAQIERALVVSTALLLLVTVGAVLGLAWALGR